MSKKPPLTWQPTIEGWVSNELGTNNHWKVRSILPTRDEVLQEAYLVYLKLCKRYPDVEEKHFMALFKTAWQRRFIDLCRKDVVIRPTVAADDATTLELGTLVGDTENQGYMNVLIKQAPREVKMVLSLLLSAPSELLELALQSSRKNEEANRQMCRWLGLPADSKPLDAVRTYFTDL